MKETQKKKETFLSGGRLSCRTVEHPTDDVWGSSSRCKEFVVERRPFNFFRWLFQCFCFSVLLYALNLHNLNSNTRVLLLVVLVAALILRIHLTVQKESLLVVSTLGLQLTTTFVSGRRESKFISSHSIESFVINEGITMHHILHYLVVVLKGSDSKEMQIIFRSTWPRLNFLIHVYNCVNAMILSQR